MRYEINAAIKTLRTEGVGSFFKKALLYLNWLGNSLRFWVARKPHGATPEAAVDFSFRTAGGLIYPAQIRSEFIQLATLVHQRRPRVIVEIGTATGGTLCAWCGLADPQATLVSIDLPGGIHGGGYAYWRTWVYRQFAQPAQHLTLLRADSHSPATVERLKQLLPPGGVDFLFIDGDHTYNGVKSDFDMYAPLVRAGGLIALHDICLHPPELNCHVDRLWAELRLKYKTREFIENPKQGGLGIGIVEL